MAARERGEIGGVKRRIEAVFLVFLGLVFLVGGRLLYLQGFKWPEFRARAERMTTRTQQVEARRGRILDRNGYGLAENRPAQGIAINPRVVKDPDATAARLATLLGVGEKERGEIAERIRRAAERRSAYVRLARGVDRTRAREILKVASRDPKLKTLTLESTPVRVYPAGRDGLQLLGNVNIDGKGIEGLELFFDARLAGHHGERRVKVSASGEPIPETEITLAEPQDGSDVRLTLDRDIQHIVEEEILNVAREQNPDAATAIVLDVATGDVLGMANYPSFGPGERKITPAMRRNRAITDLFEPGSIFKVITAAAALEYGVPTHCHCPGRRTIGKYTIGCAHRASHGSVPISRMVEVSCNLAAGTLAERVGARRMYEFLDRMGLQAPTGIEFPGEEYGRMLPPERWKTLRTVNIGFGQGIVVTPIQLLSAYAAVANDGVYLPPRLVMEADGRERPPAEGRRVMSAEKARELRKYMELVVGGQSGTGKAAKIPGYSVAGKTGTAQIARGGRYGYGYVASFAGFLPVQKPKIAILVSVWKPRRGQYGGTVSAPVFREIARQCVQYLRIPPDAPNDLRDGANRATFSAGGRAGD